MRLKQRTKVPFDETPVGRLFLQLQEEDRVRPYLKLLRASAPEPGRVPVFTPTPSHDAVTDMARARRRILGK